MDLTGKLAGLAVDMASGRLNLTIQLEEDGKQTVEGLKELAGCGKLSVSLKRWRKKRSLDANAYYWVLVSEIADRLGTSKEEVHNVMLGRYGQPEKDESGTAIMISVLDRIDLSKREDIHVKAVGHGMAGGKRFTHYMLLRGSHTYDTREMSLLINGVVSEARELGIETMSTAEVERILAAWKGGGMEAK